jgi:cobalt-precorrin 5A hydrolase
MKIAIISLTETGKVLAHTISNNLEEDPTVIRVDVYHQNVKETLNRVFQSYNCIIGIMATGIMVRNTCTLLYNKSDDPAILVIDELGKHVISLVSGHLGGANYLSCKIADIINAKPIITTATDLNHKFGVDSLARKYYFKINNLSNIKDMNSALLNNETVQIAFNHKFDFIWEDLEVRNTYEKNSSPSDKLIISNESAHVDLQPRKMVVGIGSRRNIDPDSVINAIKSAMDILDLPLKRIDSMATGYMKQNEKGIIDAAFDMDLPLEIISEELLKNFKYPDLTESTFVMDKFGVQGVCEPSSLISAGEGSTLIFRKTSYNGVTVAVAVSKF